MTEPNPYVLMGVGAEASKEEIHNAYRKLAKRYHPDLNPGDAVAERSFKEIAAAYELLSDPLERARFDREFGDSSGIDDGGAHSGAQAGASDGEHPHGPARRDTGTTPRWHASEEPSYVYRGVTIEDTGFDPDKGYEITEPDDRGRMLGLIFLVALLISLVVELSDIGQAWRPRQVRAAAPVLVSPMTIILGLVVFIGSCGAFVSWIMNGVERRARRDDVKRG
jgi:curved DNA-binding protein CbpA